MIINLPSALCQDYGKAFALFRSLDGDGSPKKAPLYDQEVHAGIQYAPPQVLCIIGGGHAQVRGPDPCYEG